MRTVSEQRLAEVLARLPGEPRVVASGNHVAPLHTLSILDRAVAEYRLYMLNAPRGIPDREGVTYETSFVGVGMRDHPRLAYFPSRLSLVPALLRDRLVPDAVLLHTTPASSGSVSLGIEVNILPAAIEAVRGRGGISDASAAGTPQRTTWPRRCCSRSCTRCPGSATRAVRSRPSRTESPRTRSPTRNGRPAATSR